MISNHAVIHTIDAYCARFPEASDYMQDLRRLLVKGTQCTSRSEFRGHITCSALVFNRAGQLLMVHHRALNRWLLPGGHVEDEDISLPAAAMRELSEEAGVSVDQITADERWGHVPVHIDRHTIPANAIKREPVHEHWDFCYALRLTCPPAMLQNAEVSSVQWWDVQTLPGRWISLCAKSRAIRSSNSGQRCPRSSRNE